MCRSAGQVFRRSRPIIYKHGGKLAASLGDTHISTNLTIRSVQAWYSSSLGPTMTAVQIYWLGNHEIEWGISLTAPVRTGVDEANRSMQLAITQREAVTDTARNLQIVSAAGSCQTKVLSQRVAHLLTRKNDPLPPSNIVAFTSTNKTTDEFQRRKHRCLYPVERGGRGAIPMRPRCIRVKSDRP